MPCTDLRVIELAGILAGPAVGCFFAELGADVVKVENPATGGDPTRGWRLPGEPTDRPSAYFCAVNWGKRSVALDLQRDLEGFMRLLAGADVLVTNFKPGDAEKLGVAPQALVARFPRLLAGCITGYGPDDPRPGFDALIQAESGLMKMNGARLPVAFIDLIAAHQLKESLLLGLWQRERTGRGGVFEVSLWQAAVSSLANAASNFLMAGFEQAPGGTEHPNLFPYGTLLRCRDGEVLLAVGTDRQFAALCRVLGRDELAREYASNADRVERREELRPRLDASHLGAEEFLARLTAEGVPSGRLRSVAEALQAAPAEWLLRSGPFASVRTLAFGPRRDLRPPPGLGEHTAEVLGNLAG
ncbi:MAG: CoA transferase [Candidatus Eremiobacterota bacterium]